ncbi:hypothetical protein MAPG_01903 [Magnaporthiopsis poae ATCC 64411]|uniref:ABM domain-containing protein n=1 Tax=Magnaporthiopsis poae (strain ATCC 64411 / 73-15) TaxID=644358 RepID=A0A0C4DPX3_MAGP6|nr:hypothetical protein MAPG_01903 [Magnaporthiopsis poae ATCC 64411]
MFVVIFETRPSPAHQSTYMSIAASLKPEISTVKGFLSNVRYRSLTRPGWLLSLSTWENERALYNRLLVVIHGTPGQVGGSTTARRPRPGTASMEDYHLRVGQVFGGEKTGDGGDNDDDPERLDATEVGAAACVVLLYGQVGGDAADDAILAACVGLPLDGPQKTALEEQGLVSWDVFRAADGSGDFVFLSSWRDEAASSRFECQVGYREQPSQGELLKIRVLRDYGKYDRREAPQFFEDAAGGETTH